MIPTFIILSCILLILLQLMIFKKIKSKRDKQFSLVAIVCAIAAIGVNTYNLFPKTTPESSSAQSQGEELYDIISRIPPEQLIETLHKAYQEWESEEIFDRMMEEQNKVILANSFDENAAMMETQAAQCDSVSGMFETAYQMGAKILADYAAKPEIAQLTFHKIIDTLLQSHTLKAIAEDYTVQILDILRHQLSGTIDRARLQDNPGESLQSYIASLTLTNEFLKLETVHMQLRRNRLASNSQLKINSSESELQKSENGDKVYEIQRIRILDKERAIIEYLAAIPPEYDGMECRQNIDLLKRDVETLIADINKTR